MNKLRINYNQNKWEEMERSIHQLYSSHPDPKSAEAAYSVSNIIADAFPSIDRREAERNSQQIIEKFTGYSLDTQSSFTEVLNTVKAQASDLAVSMKFSNAMETAARKGFDSSAYKLKIAKAFEELDGQKLTYRNDFKDMSLFTDFLVESGRLAPSMLPTMGIYFAGGALAGVTGGASMAAAKAAGAVYSGMMEAGSVAKELFRLRDDNGNKLNEEYILSAWSTVMAGVGALNLVGEPFGKVTANVGRKIFSKQAVKKMVQSGSVASLGKKFLTDYVGKGIGGEALEEAVEEWIGMATSNYVMDKSNEDERTLFEGHSKQDIIKAMAQTAVSTAKGMVLTGLPSSVAGVVQEYHSNDSSLKREANKYTGYNENSFAVKLDALHVKGAKGDVSIKKADGPIKVIDVEGAYKPINAEQASLANALKRNGAKALNIEVSNASAGVTEESVTAAASIARLLGLKSKDDSVLFPSEKERDAFTRKYALDTESVVGYRKEAGQVIIDREGEQGPHSITFAVQDNVQSAAAPTADESLSLKKRPVSQQTLLNTKAEDLKDDRTSRKAFSKTIAKLSKKTQDREFIENTVVKKVADTLLAQDESLNTSTAYAIGRSTAVWANVVANLAGMGAEEFYKSRFSEQMVSIMTPEMEAKHKGSKAFRDTVKGERKKHGTNGISLNEDIKSRGISGSIQTDEKGLKTIYIGRGSDAITVSHELAHALVDEIKETEGFQPFRELYASELAKDGGTVGRNFQERFASDFETYVVEGKASSLLLRKAMQSIVDAIKDLLGYVNRELDEKTRKAFDDLLGTGLKKEDNPRRTPVAKRKELQVALDETSDTDVVAEKVSTIANKEYTQLTLFKVSNAVKQEQKATVSDALKNHEYPSDEVLEQFKGDPDIDWEIQFRRIMIQDPDIYKLFEKAIARANESVEKGSEATVAQVVEALKEMTFSEDFVEIAGEVRDEKRFVERLMWQQKYISPSVADRSFARLISRDTNLFEVAKTLMEGVDAADAWHISHDVYRLSLYENPSQYILRAARKSIRDDIRTIRRLYYHKIGMTQQLSYEDTIAGTYLDNGHRVESFGSEEIRSLLSAKDTDPVLKSLVRKNLANGNVLQALVDTTSEQIETLEAELANLGEKATLTSEQLLEKIARLEEAEHTLGKLDDKYRNLQGINSKNYELMRRYRRLYDTKVKQLQYTNTLHQIEKLNESIDRLSKSQSSTADARIMDTLQKVVSIIRNSEGEDLSGEFKKQGLSFSELPQQLSMFFEKRDGGIYVQNPSKNMDLKRLLALRNAVEDVRKDARAEKSLRDQANRERRFSVVHQYLSETLGMEKASFDEYRQFMTEQKKTGYVKGAQDSIRKGQKHKPWAIFETKFITMNRIIRKLDGPNGKALSTFFFGGMDDNGKLHLGLEGVVDAEKRAEFKRYTAAKEKMVELGITQKELLADQITVRGTTLNLDEAIGVYVYSKQPEGLQKLLSPNGNAFSANDVNEVVSSLDSKQKAWGEWLITEMGSKYNEIADVYYKVHNKTLGQVVNYFPLVRMGRNESFSDLMEDSFLRMQENADDRITHVRIGGDYKLQLNATAIWNKMVSKQEHYIAGAEFFNDANYLMNKNGGDLFNLIAMNNGEEYAKSVQDFINRVANKRYIQDDADTMVNAVRNNLVVARLGFNILTTLKQIPALGLFAMQYGPVRLLESIAHMATDYKGTSEFIYERSPQLRNRNMSIDFSSVAQLEARGKYGRFIKKVGEVGMTPIQFVDSLIVKTLWYGAYQNNVSKGMRDEQAAMEATRWINDTQPGGTSKDSSAIYDTNSTIMKFLLMFTNQLNKNLNIMLDIPNALRQGMYEKAFRNAIGLGLSLAGIMLFEGGFEDSDDDDKLMDDVLKGFSAQMVSMMPIFGGDFSNIIMDRYYSDSGLPMVSEIASFVKALGSDDIERKIDRTVKFGLAGFEVTGLPSGQVNKIWKAFQEAE